MVGKVALFVVAGVLIGGTWSLYKQGVPKIVTIMVGLFATLALVAAVLWQF